MNNEEPRPKGTGYLRSPVELHSGLNTLNKRPEGRGIKPLSTNNPKNKEYKPEDRKPKPVTAKTPAYRSDDDGSMYRPFADAFNKAQKKK